MSLVSLIIKIEKRRIFMASHKQIVANQRNALKSTGPRTETGKAIVCQNAVKHGILCQEIPIDENERIALDEFRSRMALQLNPVGDFEHFIVDRIISSAWRLRRIVHIETAFYRYGLTVTLNLLEDLSIKNAFNDSAKDRMAVLSRYEVTIEKSLYKALAELMKLQAMRQGVQLNPLFAETGFVLQKAETNGNSSRDCI